MRQCFVLRKGCKLDGQLIDIPNLFGYGQFPKQRAHRFAEEVDNFLLVERRQAAFDFFDDFSHPRMRHITCIFKVTPLHSIAVRDTIEGYQHFIHRIDVEFDVCLDHEEYLWA